MPRKEPGREKLKCPKCGSDTSIQAVSNYPYHKDNGHHVLIRKRQCYDCGTIWRSEEIIIEEYEPQYQKGEEPWYMHGAFD